MVELKPCPFCGGKANLCAWMGGGVYWVRCANCQVDTEAFGNSVSAAKFWNTRAERTCEIVKGTFGWECDQCHERIFEAVKYCPGCGAKVVE